MEKSIDGVMKNSDMCEDPKLEQRQSLAPDNLKILRYLGHDTF